MDFFKRASVTCKLPSASIYDLLLDRKISTNKTMLVIKALKHWESCGLWQWRISTRSSGPHGVPVGLYKGIHYLDKLLCGRPLAMGATYDSLYGSYNGKEWALGEITASMSEYAKAATSNDYAPQAAATKERMRKRNLADFFYAEYIESTPCAAVHAPFLYYHVNKAVPVSPNTVMEAQCPYLVEEICKHFETYYDMAATSTDKSRIALFTNTLYEWYKANEPKLAPDDRRLDVIIDVWRNYLATWPTSPQAIVQAVGRSATDKVLANLQRLATYSERTIECRTEAIDESNSLNPDKMLCELAPDGNYLGVLIKYCELNNIEMNAKTVDSYKLAGYGISTLRQAITAYSQGELAVAPIQKKDWREVLQQYGGQP